LTYNNLDNGLDGILSFNIKFGVDNILNTDFQKIIDYNDVEHVFESYQRGVSFKLGFSYDIR